MYLCKNSAQVSWIGGGSLVREGKFFISRGREQGGGVVLQGKGGESKGGTEKAHSPAAVYKTKRKT